MHANVRPCLEESFFFVDGNGAVTLGVSNASENKASGNLVIVKEVLLGLIDLTRDAAKWRGK